MNEQQSEKVFGVESVDLDNPTEGQIEAILTSLIRTGVAVDMGQGAYGVTVGGYAVWLICENYNYGIPVNAEGKANKYPRVGSTLGYVTCPGSVKGINYQINAIDKGGESLRVEGPVKRVKDKDTGEESLVPADEFRNGSIV